MKARFRQRAQRDIENIYDYIERHNPRAATDRLGILPFIGHGRARGTYEWVVVGLPYVIVYEVIQSADEVAIIAIFHWGHGRGLNPSISPFNSSRTSACPINPLI